MLADYRLSFNLTSQTAEESTKLSQLLLPDQDHGFGRIATLSSNVEAVESALLFANGYRPFVCLSGPGGVGKSRILNACYQHMNKRGKLVSLMTAERFVRSFEYSNSENFLIIDDCQQVLDRPKQRLIFRMMLDRRVRTKRPMILAFGSMDSVQLAGLLPHPKNWATMLISEPPLEDRMRLVSHLAKDEGMKVSKLMTMMLATYLTGSGRLLSAALRRLKLESNNWSDTRQVLRACGILDVYLNDHPDFDLRGQVVDLAQTVDPAIRDGLVCFTMLKTIRLSEDSVCRYLESSAGRCYDLAERFGETLQQCPRTLSEENRFINRLVHRLMSVSADWS